MHTLEPAGLQDISVCLAIIREGRHFQQEQGFTQWTEEYPSAALIEADIRAGSGYLFKVDGQSAGYLYLSFDGDPTYAAIEGAWRSSGPYAVVHRIALSKAFAGRGLSAAAFGAVQALCEEKGIRAIRIDTDQKNARMQHVLAKNGFAHCGYVRFEGDRKLAYEKLF